MKLIMLGSGTSTGVPRVGNDWGLCDPAEPRNRRTRVSVIVQADDGRNILVDTSPDLRAQLLSADIGMIDAVLWTHDHADHCHGIDDLRPIRQARNAPVPGYASTQTVQRLRQRFSYIFSGNRGYPTIATLETLDHVRLVCGVALSSCEMPHGPMTSTAYRFDAGGKSVCYLTDFGEITDQMVSLIWRCDLLVVDALRREPHPTHATLAMALDLAERAKCARVVLTHLDKSMDYRSLCDELPAHVQPGYDGLIVTL